MTTKRLLQLLVGLLISAFALTWFLWPRADISPAAFSRIKLGMTTAEVEEIIGLPPGNHHGDRASLAIYYLKTLGIDEKDLPDHITQVATWYGNDYAIVVVLDEKGQVISFSLADVLPAPTLFGRIRSWLGI